MRFFLVIHDYPDQILHNRYLPDGAAIMLSMERKPVSGFIGRTSAIPGACPARSTGAVR
jgi:hypothetical protein